MSQSVDIAMIKDRTQKLIQMMIKLIRRNQMKYQ